MIRPGHICQIRPRSYSDNTEWRGSNLVLVSSLVLPGRLHFVKKWQNRLIPIDSVIFGLWPAIFGWFNQGHMRIIPNGGALTLSCWVAWSCLGGSITPKRQNRCIVIDSVIFGLWPGSICQIRPGSYSDITEWWALTMPCWAAWSCFGGSILSKKKLKSLYPHRQLHIQIVTRQYSDDSTGVIFG